MKSFFPLYLVPLLALGTSQSFADDFTIDPTRSFITLSGSAANLPLQEQGPGSLTTSFFGNLAADLTGSNVAITGGTMKAITNGIWLPGPNGQGAAAPANYGAQATSFLGVFTAALRNVAFDVASPATTVTNGSFDAGKMIFSFPQTSLSTLDYDAGFLGTGQKNLAGNATNKTATVATITTAGPTNTLVINIDATFFTTLASQNDSSLRILGQITAVNVSGGKEPPRFTETEVVNHEIRFKVAGDITGFKLQSTIDYDHWDDRVPTLAIENNVTVYKLPANLAFEVFRFGP